MEKGRGASNNQHLGLRRLSSYEQSLSNNPNQWFCSTASQVSVAQSGELGRFRTAKLGPQRSSVGPGAWSSHALAEDPSHSYSAADHDS